VDSVPLLLRTTISPVELHANATACDCDAGT
jgi:hypothetical protein